mgnify:CR=1 FL=1
MAARIQLRRDLAVNFTTVNPTLSAGEVGIETDTLKAKVGDGSTVWNSLSYFIFNPTFAEITNKPTTLAGYGITDAALIASPTFTGAPSAPTAASGTNTTQIATTAFVQQEVTAAGSYNDASVDTCLLYTSPSPRDQRGSRIAASA